LVSHTEGRTYICGVSNHDTEENICTEDAGSDRGLEKIA
jgi:hypothetical protein